MLYFKFEMNDKVFHEHSSRLVNSMYLPVYHSLRNAALLVSAKYIKLTGKRKIPSQIQNLKSKNFWAESVLSYDMVLPMCEVPCKTIRTQAVVHCKKG
jgi:hypothetical protein